jgi:hypothetical protein
MLILKKFLLHIPLLCINALGYGVDGLRVCFLALESMYNLYSEIVEKLIKHLVKLIFRLNTSQFFIYKNVFRSSVKSIITSTNGLIYTKIAKR